MRYLLLSSALVLASVTVASAETPLQPSAVVIGAPVTIKHTVYLDHVILEEMKKSDPERYARVREVMATASEACGNNAGRLWSIVNVPAPAGCSGMFLKPSFPPKREIGFQIDDTWYIALVTVREMPALRTPKPDKVVPVIQAK